MTSLKRTQLDPLSSNSNFLHIRYFFSPEKVSFFESKYKNLLKVDFSRIWLDEISNQRIV